MEFEIFTPTELIVKTKTSKIYFEDKAGALTLCPNHADYITTFESNILSYINEDNKKLFVALNNGVLVKYGKMVRITSYSVIEADTLEDLQRKMKLLSQKEKDEEKIDNNLKQLDMYLYDNIKKLHL
ncbi:MAG: hypothetical protein Ta2D_02960 [Rickettsiales bacterium]|nr:MAG: hypothetical protein Ta2D_02960 [Rickettsiales bacterium]